MCFNLGLPFSAIRGPRVLSRHQRDTLRTLLVIKRAPASVILRVLMAWRHGVGERDVRRMIRSFHVALDQQGYDVTGEPILRANGGQQLDANGPPAVHKPRPRAKLNYR